MTFLMSIMKMTVNFGHKFDKIIHGTADNSAQSYFATLKMDQFVPIGQYSSSEKLKSVENSNISKLQFFSHTYIQL